MRHLLPQLVPQQIETEDILKVLPLIALIILHTPATYTIGDEYIQCSTAAAITTVGVSAAIGVTLDTCMRYKRGELKDDVIFKRALIVTTVGTIIGALGLLAAATIACSEPSQ